MLILQLLLLGLAVMAIAMPSRSNSHPSRLGSDVEKSQSQHELKQVRAQSFETTKTDGSPVSQQEATMGQRKAVGFA